MPSRKRSYLRDVNPADWTEEHERELERLVAEDPDDVSLNSDELGVAKSFAEALPDLAAKMRDSGVIKPRGRPRSDITRQHVTLRLDRDVYDNLLAAGPEWRKLVNDVLRQALASRQIVVATTFSANYSAAAGALDTAATLEKWIAITRRTGRHRGTGSPEALTDILSVNENATASLQ
jgi:uncharacterized protein (DUF4415 family)